MKRVLYFVGLLIPSLVYSQPQLIEKYDAPPKSQNISYEKWKLPNGLTIILHEDHSDPIVSTAVIYKVGSSRESIGKSGFAHFFEHMMFQGSLHVKDEEHMKIIKEAGGDYQGGTQRDLTIYYETVPSNYLETTLWLEADRMGFLLDSVTQKKFEVQRATVKNEKGQRVENFPYGLANYELIGQTLYPHNHPYSWPTIGYVDDLNRVNVQDLKDFFLRWYGPNNAILLISGDFNSAEAVKMAEKYFGSINRCPDVKKLKAELPILPLDKYNSYVDNVYFPLVSMTFPAAPIYSKDEPALVILAGMMGEGNNSIFYKNFVKTDKAAEASVQYSPGELAGEFRIDVLAYPTTTFNELEKQIRETIDQFEKEGITEESIQRQKAKSETTILNSKESVLYKAILLGQSEMMAGKILNISDELDRYNRVTKEDILRVYNKYVKGKHAAIVNVYPRNPYEQKKDSVKSVNPYADYKPVADPQYQGLKYVRPVDNFDRSVRPKPGPGKTIQVPKYYSATFSNGLKIIGSQNTEVPKVVLVIDIQGGDLILDKVEKVGLASLTASMMNEGTKSYTSEQVAAELERLGSRISFSASKQISQIYVESLTKNLDATLKILEEKLFAPRFDEDDFYRVRKQMVEGLNVRKTYAEALYEEALSNVIYGETPLGAYATVKGVKKLSLSDVKDYYKKYYSPGVSNMVIVGDITQAEIMPKLEFLKKWEAKEVKLPEISNFPAVEKPQIYLVNKTEAAQSVVGVGTLAVPFDATGDYFKANVANFSLAGDFNSRVNLNLREEKGFTYGSQSYITGSKYRGIYRVYASVRRTATDSSLKELMKEINGYYTDGIKDDELAYTKSSLLSSDALKYETLGQKANFLSRIVKYNLTPDYISKQAEILKNLSKSDVNSITKKYFDPNKMVIIVVGDRNKIKKPLESLGYGKVKEIFID